MLNRQCGVLAGEALNPMSITAIGAPAGSCMGTTGWTRTNTKVMTPGGALACFCSPK
jgi:hypothetical protein